MALRLGPLPRGGPIYTPPLEILGLSATQLADILRHHTVHADDGERVPWREAGEEARLRAARWWRYWRYWHLGLVRHVEVEEDDGGA